jgi:flagellar biogenesis protein FliO
MKGTKMKIHRTCNSLLAGLAGLFLLFTQSLAAADVPVPTEANASAPAGAEVPKVYHPPKEGRPVAPGSEGLTEVALRLFGALLLVVALLLGGAWFFKRSKYFRLVKPVESRLNIAETKNLAARHNLHVVTYGSQRFLIADSPNGTQFLTQLEEPPTEEINPNDSKAGGLEEGTFAEKLKMVLDGPERKNASFGELARKFKSLFARKGS